MSLMIRLTLLWPPGWGYRIRVRQPWCRPWPCCLTRHWLCGVYVTSSSLSLYSYKMVMIIVPSSKGSCRDLQVYHLEWGWGVCIWEHVVRGGGRGWEGEHWVPETSMTSASSRCSFPHSSSFSGNGDLFSNGKNAAHSGTDMAVAVTWMWLLALPFISLTWDMECNFLLVHSLGNGY